jgi:hypothetical protein
MLGLLDRFYFCEVQFTHDMELKEWKGTDKLWFVSMRDKKYIRYLLLYVNL